MAYSLREYCPHVHCIGEILLTTSNGRRKVTEEENGLAAETGLPCNPLSYAAGGGFTMSEELKALVERARQYQMTREEIREQVIDFAFGNCHFEDQRVTREGIARAAAEFDRQNDATAPH